MKREDLGKMLQKSEEIVTWNEWAHGQEWTDIIFENAAVDFWNDVIDALCADIETRKESIWFMAFDPEAGGMDTYFADFLCGHLRRMKIGDDE